MDPQNGQGQPNALPLMGRLAAMAARAPIGPEEQLRLHHYSIFIAVGTPTMSAFGIYNLVLGQSLLGSLILVSVAGLQLGWLFMVRRGRGRVIYRANFLFFAAVTVYGADFGGAGGSYGLWSYSYPLIAFFLLGRREGLAWALVMGTGIIGAMVAPGGYAYPVGFVLRFAASYAMVVAVTYGYEHLREAGRRALEAKNEALVQEMRIRAAAEAEKETLIAELRTALDEVRTLQGLIPICSGCHQIRDDSGFWRQLESYLEAHSEARFSHGLCPACAQRLYPDFFAAVDDDAADRPRPEGP